VLHARLGGVQVQAPVLDVLVDLLGRLQEGVLHVLPAGRAEKRPETDGNRKLARCLVSGATGKGESEVRGQSGGGFSEEGEELTSWRWPPGTTDLF